MVNKTSTREDDQRLIKLTLEGQLDAFGDLIHKYQNRLFNGMVHVIRSESEAEDVVQDAFILAMTRLDSFKGNSQFYTWLYRIAYNVAITKLRRRKPTVSLQGKDDSAKVDFPGNVDAPDERMQGQERASQLMQAMGRLTEEHRSILVLREMDEMDYEAISEILDLPIGTVRSRLHRARSQLKEQLELIMDEAAD